VAGGTVKVKDELKIELDISAAYSGEVDQGSGVMPISVPVDSDQVIGAERRWQSDCVGSDRNRQERSWK
jgi:hypothetical protein